MNEKELIPLAGAIVIVPILIITGLSTYSGVDDASSDTNTESITVTYDTWISLEKQYLKEYDESVTNVTGDALVRDTDYRMNYDSGKIYFCDGEC